MTKIPCQSIIGDTKMIEKEKLSFRPSIYAVIKNEGKILIQTMKHSDMYTFPGGGIEIGEKMTDSLKREIKEECGIEIEIKEELLATDNFFYYDPLDFAMHSLLFFYSAKALSTELSQGNDIDDEEIDKNLWLPLEEIQADKFMYPFDEAFKRYKKSL